jgi:hypothetical protein
MPHATPVGLTGEHYEDTVPDTLDLVERAVLGLNYFAGMTESDLDHEVYFHADEDGGAVRLSDNPDLVESYAYSRTLG